jgi:hypothetical protein
MKSLHAKCLKKHLNSKCLIKCLPKKCLLKHLNAKCLMKCLLDKYLLIYDGKVSHFEYHTFVSEFKQLCGKFKEQLEFLHGVLMDQQCLIFRVNNWKTNLCCLTITYENI